MNKLKFMIAAAALLGTSALQSCSKNEAATPTPTQTTTKKGVNSLMRPYGKQSTYSKKTKECSGAASNCTDLPPIVITAPWENYEDGLIIAEGNGSGAVGALFNSPEFAVICANLDISSEADLKSGNYFIHLANQDAIKATYIAGTSNPVTEQNMSFAFKFNK